MTTPHLFAAYYQRRMRPFIIFLLLTSATAADWEVPGAVRRWTLTPGEGAGAVGMVRVWPQSADETTAMLMAGGRPVPCRVLWQAPGEALEIWFDAATAGTTARLYLGKDLRPADWEPPAGLILETRSRPNLPFDSAAQILALWDKAAPVQGRGLCERIFHGANPYGPQADFAARYTGWISIPSAGQWGFATISDDGSVLLIDGTEVVAWPGVHTVDAGARGERHGRVQLSAGRHRIDYRAVQKVNAYCAAVAWMPPGAKTWEMIPATAFAGVATWQADKPETPQGADWAVTWRTLAHAAPGEGIDPCLVQTRLEVIGAAGIATWRCDDGTVENGRLVNHWWLKPGLRSLTVEVQNARKGPRQTRTLNIAVHPDWQQPDLLPAERPHQWRKILAERPYANLPPGELVAALHLALAADETSMLAALDNQALGLAKAVAAADPALLLRFALRLQGAELRRYATSATLLAAITAPAPAAARAHLHLGGLRLLVDGDGEAAEAAWRTLDATALDANDRRLLAIYRADARALAGDAVGARASFRALPAVADPDSRTYVMRRRLRLELARDRLSQGKWDEAEQALREIEWETPLERLGEETGLLFLRLWTARSELQLARTRVRMLLAGEGGPREPEVLLAAARIELAAKDAVAAQRLIERLKKDHPYSEAAAMASELGSHGDTETRK